MKRNIISLVVMALLLSCNIIHARVTEIKVKSDDNFYDKYYFNIPKLRDCQTIRTDESFLNEGKKKKNVKFKQKDRKICYWDVEIQGKKLIMWTQPDGDKYGFIPY